MKTLALSLTLGALLSTAPAFADDVSLRLVDQSGDPVSQALVTLHPVDEANWTSVAGLSAQMSQRDLQFVPGTLVVPVGSSVSFPNEDDTGHHVYSFSEAKRFDLRIIPGGQSDAVVFDEVGTVAVGCNIHDAMVGFIHVVDTPWALETDEEGQVSWDSVPEGAYELRIWHPRSAARDQEQSFDLQLTGEQVELEYELDLRRARRRGGRY